LRELIVGNNSLHFAEPKVLLLFDVSQETTKAPSQSDCLETT